MYERPRCREWTPLATQQLRLRNLIQITGHNLISEPKCSHYYTLHLTSMCAPFYTSEKLENLNPSWSEIDCEVIHKLSSKAVYIRVWKHLKENTNSDMILLTWGVFFSGLVLLERRDSKLVHDNSLVFHMDGGFFTSHNCVINNQLTKSSTTESEEENIDNGVSEINESDIIHENTNSNLKIRYTTLGFLNSEIRKSYNVEKLLRIQQMQRLIKNRLNSAKDLRDKICQKSAICLETNPSKASENKIEEKKNTNHHMGNLGRINRYILQQKPKLDPEKTLKALSLHKQIESARFVCRLLNVETDSVKATIRNLHSVRNAEYSSNNDLGSLLMSQYHTLSKERERYKQWQSAVLALREFLAQTRMVLYKRQARLLNETLEIYPINEDPDGEYAILGVALPSAEKLSTAHGIALSVALGFTAHAVYMASYVLNVPLRYSIIHVGSRSKIIDNVTHTIPENEREFPLHCRTNPPTESLHYAVYLLNKNIAQLRWLIGLQTKDLRSILPNLKGLLQGLSTKEKLFSVPLSALSNSGSSADLSVVSPPLPNRLLMAKVTPRKIINYRVSRSESSFTENRLLETQSGNFSSEPILSAKIIDIQLEKTKSDPKTIIPAIVNAGISIGVYNSE